MTPHQTLAVAVRLFAILLAFYVVRELIGVYVAGRERSDAYILPVVGAVLISAVVFVVLLWFFPRTIARGLLPLTSDTPAKPSNPEAWLVVGSSLIGLWLVASAVPGVMRNLFVMYLYRSDWVEVDGLIPGLVYLVVQVLVGFVLIFGANGVKRFIVWARYAGPN